MKKLEKKEMKLVLGGTLAACRAACASAYKACLTSGTSAEQCESDRADCREWCLCAAGPCP